VRLQAQRCRILGTRACAAPAAARARRRAGAWAGAGVGALRAARAAPGRGGRLSRARLGNRQRGLRLGARLRAQASMKGLNVRLCRSPGLLRSLPAGGCSWCPRPHAHQRRARSHTQSWHRHVKPVCGQHMTALGHGRGRAGARLHVLDAQAALLARGALGALARAVRLALRRAPARLVTALALLGRRPAPRGRHALAAAPAGALEGLRRHPAGRMSGWATKVAGQLWATPLHFKRCQARRAVRLAGARGRRARAARRLSGSARRGACKWRGARVGARAGAHRSIAPRRRSSCSTSRRTASCCRSTHCRTPPPPDARMRLGMASLFISWRAASRHVG